MFLNIIVSAVLLCLHVSLLIVLGRDSLTVETAWTTREAGEDVRAGIGILVLLLQNNECQKAQDDEKLDSVSFM